MSYLRNAWYIAAWADEIADDAPLGRMICEEPVVLFRGAGGKVAALQDRCPHRFAPLSYGLVQDGELACRYHGLRFDGSGECVLNPHGPIMKNARPRAFPAHEAYRAIWIWMGDPSLADPAKIPDMTFIDRALPTAFNKGYLHVRANYLLLADNILDLSHVDFLHPTSIGSGGRNGGGTVTGNEAEVELRDTGVVVRWVNPDAAPSPLDLKTRSMSPGDKIRRTIQVDWRPAAIMLLTNTTEYGDGESTLNQQSENFHVLTPETEKTAHYFFASTRNFAQEDADLNDRIAASRKAIFESEDEWICQGVQERMGNADFWDLRPALLPTDVAAVQMRRSLKRFMAAEQG